MIRRILLVAAAAVALALVPSAAMAYDAPGFDSSVSDATPAPGSSVTMIVKGLPNQALKLTVTYSVGGVKTYRTTANAKGVATFTFKAASSGTMTAVVTNAAGDVVSSQELTVSGSGPGNGKDKKLKDTGFNGMGLAAGGGGLVLLGAGAVVVAKRRRSAQVPA